MTDSAVDTTGRGQAIRAVPVRHPGRWLVVVVLANTPGGRL